MRIFNFEIKKIKKEKVLPPNVYAIVKINDVAKENGIYDDENKIIEINSFENYPSLKLNYKISLQPSLIYLYLILCLSFL